MLEIIDIHFRVYIYILWQKLASSAHMRVVYMLRHRRITDGSA